MKPQKKRRLWWLWAGAAVLAAAGGFAIWWSQTVPPGITLRFGHELGNPRVVAAVQGEIAKFEGLYPRLRVELVQGTASADVGLTANYPADDSEWTFPLTPWSGSLWVLAARRDRLEALNAPETAALRAGTLEPQGFVKVLEKVKAKGAAPITLGNRHLWPFVLWLQMWSAATQGPQAAFPEPPYATVKSAMDELRRWRTLGWFEEGAWPQGWAQGLGPLQDGQAVFALMNESQLTALRPATRAALEFLPFPRRASDGPWSLGSAHFLAVSAKTAHPDEAKQLVQFLTSPGVTERLAQITGRPFFAWKAQGKAPTVLPDWSSRANDPAFRALAEELAK
jgi:ABC-type glycerol-3-phosphate transport system substrate-binding protein